MVDRTSMTIKTVHARAIDALHIRWMNKTGKKSFKTDFFGQLIKMGNDMIDMLEDPTMSPLVKAFLEGSK